MTFQRKDGLGRAKRLILHYLSRGPRSEGQVRQKLKGRFEGWVTEETVTWLRDKGHLDDKAFAQFWKENRLEFRPRSRNAMKIELTQRGVEPTLASEVLEDVDDVKAARMAALKKTRVLRGMDYPGFRSKLGSFLRRRGFDYGIIRQTIEALWSENNPNG